MRKLHVNCEYGIIFFVGAICLFVLTQKLHSHLLENFSNYIKSIAKRVMKGTLNLISFQRLQNQQSNSVSSRCGTVWPLSR